MSDTWSPRWPYCGTGATQADPVGCPGILLENQSSCLAHASDEARSDYLQSLRPGASFDLRGTPFTEELFQQVANRLRVAPQTTPEFGRVDFSLCDFQAVQLQGAAFHGMADFTGATFNGVANFMRVTFERIADFRAAIFNEAGMFDMAVFESAALFEGANFMRQAAFSSVKIKEEADFKEVQVSGEGEFYEVNFSADADFQGAVFSDSVWMERATFQAAPQLGPLSVAGQFDLSHAVFEVPVTIEMSAQELRCRRTRWNSTVTMRLRYAQVDLSDAVIDHPMALMGHLAPFDLPLGQSLDESKVTDAANPNPSVYVTSIRGVDAAHLVLTDVDLSRCLFVGAFHLDQIRLEGHCDFAYTPRGLHFGRTLVPVRWWTKRRVIAEEHHWRALFFFPSNSRAGWSPVSPSECVGLGPRGLAAAYRQLRKGYEDGKDEPGAADFYYGEMEMRRKDRMSPLGERGLLSLYWLLSGYGLRASRAFGWLLLFMSITVLLMLGIGLPGSTPKQVASGNIPPNLGRVTLTIDKQDATLTLPRRDRFTRKRLDQALQVVLNSVIFRASGQDLTPSGTYLEMLSRLTEPVLLGLGVLAVRGRIKRG
nr:pentapeptide repeat-containing protein [Streptomyces durhamensis]